MKKIYIFFYLILILGCSRHTDYIGEKYLGATYAIDPLGEGVNSIPDSDPLIRFDAFDCQTFVETALADDDLEQLNKIRYNDGKIGFINRNHFFIPDWLTNNSGLIKNISSDFGKTDIHGAIINKGAWFNKVHKIKTGLKPESAEIKYVKYNNLNLVMPKESVLVAFITNNPKLMAKIGSDTIVSHVGFL